MYSALAFQSISSVAVSSGNQLGRVVDFTSCNMDPFGLRGVGHECFCKVGFDVGECPI